MKTQNRIHTSLMCATDLRQSGYPHDSMIDEL